MHRWAILPCRGTVVLGRSVTCDRKGFSSGVAHGDRKSRRLGRSEKADANYARTLCRGPKSACLCSRDHQMQEDIAMASRKPIVYDRPLRGRIYDSIAETIGNTPLVRIPNITAEDGIKADICLKLEFFNPISSVKDRIGVNMILAMEADG